MTNHQQLNLQEIQGQLQGNKNKKRLNELGELYDLRTHLNPLRWSVKKKHTNIKTHFTFIKEQVRSIL